MAQVVQVKREEKEGYAALQLGCGSKRDKQLNGTEIGHFGAANVPNKRMLQEFRISQVGLYCQFTPYCMAYKEMDRLRALLIACQQLSTSQ